MTSPTIDNSPSGIINWIEGYIRDLAGQASAEVLTQHEAGLTQSDVQLRLMVLAQMVASHTTPAERLQWSLEMIAGMAEHFGTGLDET